MIDLFRIMPRCDRQIMTALMSACAFMMVLGVILKLIVRI
jgi:hypothetical protein